LIEGLNWQAVGEIEQKSFFLTYFLFSFFFFSFLPCKEVLRGKNCKDALKSILSKREGNES